jgi:hypothetical protein
LNQESSITPGISGRAGPLQEDKGRRVRAPLHAVVRPPVGAIIQPRDLEPALHASLDLSSFFIEAVLTLELSGCPHEATNLIEADNLESIATGQSARMTC